MKASCIDVATLLIIDPSFNQRNFIKKKCKIINLVPLVVSNFNFSPASNLFTDLVFLLYPIMQFWSLSQDLDVDHYKRTLTITCYILIRSYTGVPFYLSLVITTTLQGNYARHLVYEIPKSLSLCLETQTLKFPNSKHEPEVKPVECESREVSLFIVDGGLHGEFGIPF